jgi:hypothetical protein
MEHATFNGLTSDQMTSIKNLSILAKKINSGGSISINGDLDVKGKLNVEDDVLVKKDLIVYKNATVTGVTNSKKGFKIQNS